MATLVLTQICDDCDDERPTEVCPKCDGTICEDCQPTHCCTVECDACGVQFLGDRYEVGRNCYQCGGGKLRAA